MTLEYYRKATLITPAIFIIFSAIVLVLSAVYFSRNEYSTIKIVFSLIICIHIIYGQLNHFKYGIRLLHSQTEVFCEGVITNITKPKMLVRFYYNGKIVHGHLIDIEGVEYYSILPDDISEGDNVVFKYLNDSMFVLEMEKK